MESQNVELTALGWSDWFASHVTCAAAETLARVAAVDREQLVLMDQGGTFRAKLSGSYLHRYTLAQEMPCVGDWVIVEKRAGENFGVVRERVERRTSLRRKSAGDAVEHQMIAANVDVAVIVQSCHTDFNVNRLERYLVMVRDGGAEPLILLTKTDLMDSTAVDAQQTTIRAAGIVAPIVALSSVTRTGIDELKRQLLPGKTYCFVGSSGVGKSTLINHLIGRTHLEIGAVSATGEGRHTTVRRELIRLDGGALVIDNPGMREFGLLGEGAGVENNFADIAAFAADCRYRNCGHTSEPGCAVLEAVQSGALSQAQYENYVKLRQESSFNQLSYAEKRKKDRKFGRFIKSVKKDLRKD